MLEYNSVQGWGWVDVHRLDAFSEVIFLSPGVHIEPQNAGLEGTVEITVAEPRSRSLAHALSLSLSLSSSSFLFLTTSNIFPFPHKPHILKLESPNQRDVISGKSKEM